LSITPRRNAKLSARARIPKLAVLLLLMAAAVVFGRSASAGRDGPLVLDTIIRLDDVSGRIDHMAFDPHRNRLIVAELGNDTVDVVDLSTTKLVGRIRGLREPQGVGYSDKADRIVVANAGDGSVRFYGAQTLEPAGEIPLGDDADNIHVDPRTGSVVVGYGSSGLAIIDPAKGARVADIKLRAHPEGFQIAAAST
jgi:DNA-binding beta-propeller fold protein YncE